MDFDNRNSWVASLSPYLGMSGSSNRFMGRIWRLGEPLAAALNDTGNQWIPLNLNVRGDRVISV